GSALVCCVSSTGSVGGSLSGGVTSTEFCWRDSWDPVCKVSPVGSIRRRARRGEVRGRVAGVGCSTASCSSCSEDLSDIDPPFKTHNVVPAYDAHIRVGRWHTVR